MKIREAVIPADFDNLLYATIACARETEGTELDPNIARSSITKIMNRPDTTYYVVEKDGAFVASCWVLRSWCSDWRDSHNWLLETLYVMPEFRRMGVVIMIIDHLTNLISKTKDANQLRLVVEKSNQKAYKCYQKAGFLKLNYDIMYLPIKNNQ